MAKSFLKTQQGMDWSDDFRSTNQGFKSPEKGGFDCEGPIGGFRQKIE